DELKKKFPHLDIEGLQNKYQKRVERMGEATEDEKNRALTLMALDNLNKNQPEWSFATAFIYLEQMYEMALKSRGSLDFHNLIEILIEEGIYDPEILNSYTAEE